MQNFRPESPPVISSRKLGSEFCAPFCVNCVRFSCEKCDYLSRLLRLPAAKKTGIGWKEGRKEDRKTLPNDIVDTVRPPPLSSSSAKCR